jgi:hypothetical protein
MMIFGNKNIYVEGGEIEFHETPRETRIKLRIWTNMLLNYFFVFTSANEDR